MLDYNSLFKQIHTGYNSRTKNGITLFSVPEFDKSDSIVHGFSGRFGGVSDAPFKSLNLGWNRDEPKANIYENYQRFCKAAGLEYESLALVSYEHGTNICRADRSDRGRGFNTAPFPACDALITNDPEVTLVTLHADCIVFYFFDPVVRAAGIAHAGWRGTLGRIGQKTIEKMCAEYGCSTKDMLAAVGPGICRKCYEVDEALGKKFMEAFPGVDVYSPGAEGKVQLDIESTAIAQILDSSIKPENISAMQLCTYEHPDWFFSYRRDKRSTGAMAAYIRII